MLFNQPFAFFACNFPFRPMCALCRRWKRNAFEISTMLSVACGCGVSWDNGLPNIYVLTRNVSNSIGVFCGRRRFAANALEYLAAYGILA